MIIHIAIDRSAPVEEQSWTIVYPNGKTRYGAERLYELREVYGSLKRGIDKANFPETCNFMISAGWKFYHVDDQNRNKQS